MERIKAKDFMTSKVITLSPDMDVYEAVQILVSRKITGAPVIDKSGNVVGVFSERGAVRLLASGAYHELPGAKVEAYMKKDFQTIEEDTDLMTVAHMFTTGDFRRLPVLKNGKLCGLVSRWDVMTMVLKLKDNPPDRTSGLYISALDD